MSGNKQILDALNFLVSKKSGNDFIGSFVSNDQNSEPGYFLLFFGRADLCGSLLDYSLNYKTKSGFVDFKAITNVSLTVNSHVLNCQTIFLMVSMQTSVSNSKKRFRISLNPSQRKKEPMNMKF